MAKTSRNIIITGGGSGIGMETAIKFANNGDKVIITGRTESKLVEVSKNIKQNNGNCSYYVGDVADPSFVEETVEDVIKKYGKIDILMNNAGHSSKNRNTQNTGLEDIVNVFNSNLVGTVLFTQAVLNNMKSHNNGLIINISSVAGLSGSPIAGLSYGAAKAAVINFTEYLNIELKNTMVKATAIMPGEVDTPIMDQRPIVPSEEGRKSMAKSVDVAETIFSLASLSESTSIHSMVIMPNKMRNVNSEIIMPE